MQKNAIAKWKVSGRLGEISYKDSTMFIYPVRNERRLSPYSMDIDERDEKKWKRLGVLSVSDMENRWNSGLIRVYMNKKTKKEYGTIYRDGCFSPYNFTFII